MKKKVKIIIGIVFVVIVLIGTSYALWSDRASQESINKITSDCLRITLSDQTSPIELEKAYPITDSAAKELNTLYIYNNQYMQYLSKL